MSGFVQAYLCLLSIPLPIAVTVAALPYYEMSLSPRFDKLQNIPYNSINPERVQKFFANAGLGTTGLFVVVVLGPVVVRSVLRWQNRRRRREQQRLSAALIIPAVEKEKAEEPLIFGENPDYHGDHVPMETEPPPSSRPPRHLGRIRHLRIHSLDELPPPTMDDISLPHPSWSCPVSPVFESLPPRRKTERRRSPFKPVVPGMKTTWEEGVDPVTGRRWRRKLVVYTSLETIDRTSDKKNGGGSGIKGNNSVLES